MRGATIWDKWPRRATYKSGTSSAAGSSSVLGEAGTDLLSTPGESDGVSYLTLACFHCCSYRTACVHTCRRAEWDTARPTQYVYSFNNNQKEERYERQYKCHDEGKMGHRLRRSCFVEAVHVQSVSWTRVLGGMWIRSASARARCSLQIVMNCRILRHASFSLHHASAHPRALIVLLSMNASMDAGCLKTVDFRAPFLPLGFKICRSL